MKVKEISSIKRRGMFRGRVERLNKGGLGGSGPDSGGNVSQVESP